MNTFLLHFKHNIDTPKWGIKEVSLWQFKETPIKYTDLKLEKTPEAAPNWNLNIPILEYILSYSIMQSPSWEGNWFPARQPILQCIYIYTYT